VSSQRVPVAGIPDPRDSGPLWLALFVAVLLLIGTGTPSRTQVLDLFVVVAVLAISLRWRLGALAVAVLFLVGVQMRFAFIGVGFSDVLAVTDLAISQAFAGFDPYGHGYANSTPPGAPFAYGPLTLIWYRLVDEPRALELAVSLVILAALAVRGRPLGLAVYAVLPVLLVTASDGSNDTSAGLFLLIALLAAPRSPIVGGALLGLAFGFKPYALAWLPPLLAFNGVLGPLVAFLAGSLATWGPALVIWGPQSILTSFRLADSIHTTSYYSLLYSWGPDAERFRELFDRLRYGFGALLAGASWFVVRSPGSMIVWGALIFLVTLFMGYWSTFAYFAAIAPIVCWHLDEWLGLDYGRVRWPGDPVARITGWVDRRWPVRVGSPRIIAG